MRMHLAWQLLIGTLGLFTAATAQAQSRANLAFRAAETAGVEESTPAVRLGKPRVLTARAQKPDTAPLEAVAIGQAPFEWLVPVEESPPAPAAAQTRRVWGGVEYLLFWFEDQSVAIPMVTAAPAGSVNPGIVGSPGTSVLFGNQNIDFGRANGLRFTLGGWLDSCANYGVEGSGFGFERRAKIYNFASDGNSTLALPFFNLTTNTEAALPIGTTRTPGQVEISSNIKLWGAEVNGIVNLMRSSGFDADLLAGVRYLDLAEGLYLSAAQQGPAPFSLQDSFATSNHFLAGQIGGRITGSWQRFFATATAKIALGAVEQEIEIDGYVVRTPPGPASNGGLYTQLSNSGQFSRTEFAYMPELDLKVGFKITQNFKITAGYNFLWISSVVRPGDQLDRRVNVTQNPAYGGNPAAPIGPRGPTVPFNDTTFWAHGATLGLEFVY